MRNWVPADRVARLLAYGAGGAMMVMMGITITDITLRNLFSIPILGTYEVVQLTMTFVVFLGIPELLLHNRQITVDVVDHFVSGRTLKTLRLFGTLLGIAFLVTMCWMMAVQASSAYEFDDHTTDLAIPLTVFWAPIILGGACGVVMYIHAGWREMKSKAAGPDRSSVGSQT